MRKLKNNFPIMFLIAMLFILISCSPVIDVQIDPNFTEKYELNVLIVNKNRVFEFSNKEGQSFKELTAKISKYKYSKELFDGIFKHTDYIDIDKYAAALLLNNTPTSNELL